MEIEFMPEWVMKLRRGIYNPTREDLIFREEIRQEIAICLTEQYGGYSEY